MQAKMMYLRLNSRHSVRFKRIRQSPFNIPYAFFVTTVAPNNLLLKYFCCLFVLFSLYDLISQENLGKALSPTVTSGISPKFPNAILRSGTTNPLII